MTIVGGAVGAFCLFKLLPGVEELCSRHLLFADRCNENQIQTTNVVNGNSGVRVCRATDGRSVERKTKRAIELFPSLNQFQGQMMMLKFFVVCAVQILLLELRLVPLFDQSG